LCNIAEFELPIILLLLSHFDLHFIQYPQKNWS